MFSDQVQKDVCLYTILVSCWHISHKKINAFSKLLRSCLITRLFVRVHNSVFFFNFAIFMDSLFFVVLFHIWFLKNKMCGERNEGLQFKLVVCGTSYFFHGATSCTFDMLFQCNLLSFYFLFKLLTNMSDVPLSALSNW